MVYCDIQGRGKWKMGRKYYSHETVSLKYFHSIAYFPRKINDGKVFKRQLRNSRQGTKYGQIGGHLGLLRTGDSLMIF
jgi:hypothetical protein